MRSKEHMSDKKVKEGEEVILPQLRNLRRSLE